MAAADPNRTQRAGTRYCPATLYALRQPLQPAQMDRCMKRLPTALLSSLLLAGLMLTAADGWGQVDPAWLRSWNEAQESRPEIMNSSGRIASAAEDGIPLIIHGRVFRPDGKPADGVVVHAYHRDHDGFEFGPNDNSLTTWELQGWAKTDAEGRFEFRTIRPAPDHLGREGAHIHFTLESSDFGRQWAPKVFLSDDPLVTADQRRRSKDAGEFAWVLDVQTADGVQHVDVTIRLKEEADF